MPPADVLLSCDNVTLAFGPKLVLRDLSFSVRRGSIFALMGGSGCSKSTVLRCMIGLLAPANGRVLIEGEDLWAAGPTRRAAMGRRYGVLFQSAALWSSLTVGENVALPLRLLTKLNGTEIETLVRLKLALVGMGAAEAKRPAELSGGMRKRAGLARAIALEPDILFFDEPSAGLDPITSHRLDELILELRDGLGATVVMVSHELPSLFSICDDGVFLDADARTAIAHGSPRALRDSSTHPTVRSFMRRGETGTAATGEHI
jgi:phospholipid/cholesterol/gamma-HCH transport system ATP-binding protein